MASVSSASLLRPPTTASGLAASRPKQRTAVGYITGLKSFGGLKAQNKVMSLGQVSSTEQCFAKIVSSMTPREGRRGGALSAKCSAAAEIFRIAAIMNGLVLVGVAVGFVLLRVEASLEEAE